MTALDFEINYLLLLSQPPSLNCESFRTKGLSAMQLNENINSTNWLQTERQISIHFRWMNVYMSSLYLKMS